MLEGSFRWADGSDVVITQRYPGEPNNTNNEDCVTPRRRRAASDYPSKRGELRGLWLGREQRGLALARRLAAPVQTAAGCFGSSQARHPAGVVEGNKRDVFFATDVFLC